MPVQSIVPLLKELKERIVSKTEYVIYQVPKKKETKRTVDFLFTNKSFIILAFVLI